MNSKSISLDDFSIITPDSYPAAQEGLALDGYIQWKNNTVYYSPSLGACPYKPLVASEIENLILRNSYPCPYPIGREQMWSATVIFKSTGYYKGLIENLER